jgi:hypothetical protein
VNIAIWASVLPVLFTAPPKVVKISFFLSAVNCMAFSKWDAKIRNNILKCGYKCEKVSKLWLKRHFVDNLTQII